jgi:hypothetical protein
VSSIVAETHVVEFDPTHDVAQRHETIGILILRPLPHNLLRPLESGQRFGELSSDGNDLHDGRHQKAQQQSVGEESADR